MLPIFKETLQIKQYWVEIYNLKIEFILSNIIEVKYSTCKSKIDVVFGLNCCSPHKTDKFENT